MRRLVLTGFVMAGSLLSLGAIATDMTQAQAIPDHDYLLGRNCTRKLDNVITPAAGGESVALSEITFTVENSRLTKFLGQTVDYAQAGFIDIGETWSWGGSPFEISTSINQGFVTSITCERFYNIY